MEVKWVFYKSSTEYDFDEDRAVVLKIMYSTNGKYQEDADVYLEELDKRFGDGYCWMDEIEIEY